MVVTEVRDEKRDKYSAVQVGYGIKKERPPKAELGHLKEIPAVKGLKNLGFQQMRPRNMPAAQALIVQRSNRVIP